MTQPEIRCEGDRELHETLLDIDEVKAARKKLDENPSGSARRRLLATALRLTRSMSPRLHDMLTKATERLGVSIPIEVYVYNSPRFNAACVKPEDGTLLLMFSSSLLEKFDETELSFVMGHELGHHMFGHHDIPIGEIIGGESKVSPQLALQLFSWSRYAEISADRAGAMCTENDADGAARTLFKLASGVTTDLIEIHIDDFAAQADEMDLETTPGKSERSEDWFMTHPFSPLRVKGLQMFFQSELMKEGGTGRTQLEADTHELMTAMSPTYLEEKSDAAETMRRVLFAAGCGLMNVSGDITKEEIAAFESLLGEGRFGEHLDLDALAEVLDKRIQNAVDAVPHGRRIHIIRDLCLIALADGRVSAKERKYIHMVGKKLGLGAYIVEQCLSHSTELD